MISQCRRRTQASQREMDMERERSIQQMESVKQCVVSLTGLYNEHASEKEKLSEIEQKAGDMITGSLSWLYLGLIWCSLSFAPVFFWLGDRRNGGLAIAGLLIFVMGVGYFIKSAKKYAAGKEARKTAAKEYYERETALVAKKIREIEERTKNFIESMEYKDAVLLIPEAYMDLDSISDLIRILQDRRANSIPEALHVYENDPHRQRREIAANRRSGFGSFPY